VTLYGAVELGGTKTSCAVGSFPGDLAGTTTFPTTEPGETLDRIVHHLHGRDIDSIGVSSFGPVELRPDHPEYGHVTVTPKPGWSGADVVGTIRAGLGVPVGFDTDVIGAALGEGRWGAGRGFDTFVYVTVGTGIGGGAMIDGASAHGLGHPEMGHVSVRRHRDDRLEGVCPFHGDCLEGLASGPAIETRFGVPADQLRGATAVEATAIEAFYLTQLVQDLVYVLAPERVIIGGGVSQMPGLLDLIAATLVDRLGGYPGRPEHGPGFVVHPALGPHSGLAGSLVLAEGALR
jgi:fructokinase